MTITAVAAGSVLQVLGVVTTGYGLTRTFAEFKHPDDRLLPPIDVAIRAALMWIKRVPTFGSSWRRHTVARDLELRWGTEPASSQETERLHQWDSTVAGKPVQRALDALDEALRRLDQKIDESRAALEAELRLRDDRLMSFRTEVFNELEAAAERDRKIAAGGFRTQAVGLMLVGLGVVVQSFGPSAADVIEGFFS